MPLNPRTSVSRNISELHSGKTYNRTKAKFGKPRADKQAVAIALSTARKDPANIKGLPTAKRTGRSMILSG